MKTPHCFGNWNRIVLLSLVMLLPTTLKAAGQVTIQLISARDHIEGSFLGNQAVYADKDRIYLASFQGKLFVLARDRSAGFPLIEVVQDTTSPLTAVRGDSKNLYVTSTDGNLRVYRKEDPLLLIDTISLSSFGLSSLALEGKNLYVSRGQANLAVDKDHVYLSELNEGDIGLEIGKKALTSGLTYGETFEQNTTVVFDRMSGNRVLGITNPSDLFGRLAAVTLYVDQKTLIQTIAGCCGPGIFIYDLQTFNLDQFIPRPFTNTVVRSDRWLIAGNEGGQVDVFDLRQNPSPLLSSIDLRQLTGHTGSEDIEIRALWKDNLDNLIFAGSSWGNDQSRGPSLPSFFVLELVKGK
jgi:hypothetical protein